MSDLPIITAIDGWTPKRSCKRLGISIYMVEMAKMPDPFSVIRRLPKGSTVILRSYHYPHRESLAQELKKLCHAQKLTFLVAKDEALAERVKADGVHLPEIAAYRAVLIKAAHPKWIVTAAAHDARSLVAINAACIDAVLISPVFPTSTHLRAKTLGLHGFALLASQSPVPAYALGGISPQNASLLKRDEVAGIAGISGFSPL